MSADNNVDRKLELSNTAKLFEITNYLEDDLVRTEIILASLVCSINNPKGSTRDAVIDLTEVIHAAAATFLDSDDPKHYRVGYVLSEIDRGCQAIYRKLTSDANSPGENK